MPNKETREKNVFRLTRRKALKGLAIGLGALALPARDASASVWEEFFQKNFRELSRPEIDRVIARLEKEYSAQYRKPVKVKATLPVE